MILILNNINVCFVLNVCFDNERNIFPYHYFHRLTIILLKFCCIKTCSWRTKKDMNKMFWYFNDYKTIFVMTRPPLCVQHSTAHSTPVTPGAVGPNNKNMSVKNEYVKLFRAPASLAPAFCHILFYFLLLLFCFSLSKDNRV